MESKSSEAKVGNDEEFLDGLMPSEETQAKKFLSHANGVGVVVAVFGTYSHHKIMRIYSHHDTLYDTKRYTQNTHNQTDTGCDPASANLRECPDGSPKIIDIVDATGCCDVSMDKVVDLPEKEDGKDWIELKGISGRTLKLSAKMKNPTKKLRLGLKLAYELFSKGLLKRMKSERKKKFDEKH